MADDGRRARQRGVEKCGGENRQREKTIRNNNQKSRIRIKDKKQNKRENRKSKEKLTKTAC